MPSSVVEFSDMNFLKARSFEIPLPTHVDGRGRITIVEGEHLPFAIRRVYYLSELSSGKTRGAHAHKTLEQVLIAVSGSFDVYLSDGERELTYRPKRHVGLYVGPYLWHEIRNCSSDAVCLMLASLPYDESDYIRDFDAFCALVKGAK